jgi:hypothetical protein
MSVLLTELSFAFDAHTFAQKRLEQVWTSDVLANWRAAHAYPKDPFQAILRKKPEFIDQRALVAQRLKRAPSIILKLTRLNRMRLVRLQDIGGLRAVSTIPQARKLETAYRTASFQHESEGRRRINALSSL